MKSRSYGHNLLAHKRDARGANLHPGVSFHPGAVCAYEHGFKSCHCSANFPDYAVHHYYVPIASQLKDNVILK